MSTLRFFFPVHGCRMQLPDSPSSTRTRARFDAPCNLREPLRRTPLSPCSFTPSGCRFCQARDLTAAGHGAAAATAAAARVRAHQRAQHTPRSRAHPPDPPPVRSSAEPDCSRASAAAKPRRRHSSRPHRLQPVAPLDAAHSQESSKPSRASNHRRRAISEDLRRGLCHRRLNAGGLTWASLVANDPLTNPLAR